MPYQQFEPHIALQPYIDAYWVVTGHDAQAVTQRILPDGCVDIIMNPGEDLPGDEDGFCIKNGGTYLVGTMTEAIETCVQPGTHLLGIRFKPAGFSAFYKYASLHELTDQTIDFENKLSPDLGQALKHSISYLDRFFLSRLCTPDHALFQVVQNIERQKGLLSISDLTHNYHLSARQLERKFKQFVGISPKEFMNVVRFRHAFENIKNNPDKKSLLHIAFDTGYYDHAHLTHAIKKYAGIAPSRL